MGNICTSSTKHNCTRFRCIRLERAKEKQQRKKNRTFPMALKNFATIIPALIGVLLIFYIISVSFFLYHSTKNTCYCSIHKPEFGFLAKICKKKMLPVSKFLLPDQILLQKWNSGVLLEKKNQCLVTNVRGHDFFFFGKHLFTGN